MVLQGATVVDLSITITPALDYQLPPGAASAQPAVGLCTYGFLFASQTFLRSYLKDEYNKKLYIFFILSFFQENNIGGGAASAVQKAEDVVSSMIAKGFILGKGALSKAKALDEKHQLTTTATSTVVNLDKRIGLSEKISMTTSVVNDKVRVMDEKFQVSEKTKLAFAAAEQTVSSAGSAIMSNQYVSTGASWVTGAFSKVASAAGELGQKAKEKVVMTEDEDRRTMVEDFAKVHLSESVTPKKVEEEPELPPSKPTTPAEGLVI